MTLSSSNHNDLVTRALSTEPWWYTVGGTRVGTTMVPVQPEPAHRLYLGETCSAGTGLVNSWILSTSV